MGYREVMDMPIRAFWCFLRNVDRLEAQALRYRLQVAVAAQSGEGAQELSEQLDATMGKPVEPDVLIKPLDKKGLQELAQMNNAFR